MRPYIDDLPEFRAAHLQAKKAVPPAAVSTVLRLGDVEFTVELGRLQFPNGGFWQLFICPQCSKRAQVLRVLDSQLICAHCCKRRGMVYQSSPGYSHRRAERTVRRTLDQLTNSEPARVNPRPGRMLDKRSRLQRKLDVAMATWQANQDRIGAKRRFHKNRRTPT
jgi:hypothetical protein